MMKLIKNSLVLLLIMVAAIQAEDGKIKGLVFFNYSHDTAAGAVNGFGLSRVYFSYERNLSEGISYKFQTDIDYKSSPFNVYLKNAKVTWKSPVGKVIIGLQGMNIFNIQEKTWGYRSIQKSAMDLNKWASSADMGLAYSKTLAGKTSLKVMITNGTGYKKSENDSYKKISGQLVYGEKKLLKKDGFHLGSMVAYEPYDYEVDSTSLEKKTRLVTGVFGGFSGMGIRAGGEFNRFNDAGPGNTRQLISGYANYRIGKKFDIYLRYDQLDPDTEMSNDGESLLIAGASFSPGKGLKIMPNFRYEAFEDTSIDSQTSILVNFEFKL